MPISTSNILYLSGNVATNPYSNVNVVKKSQKNYGTSPNTASLLYSNAVTNSSNPASNPLNYGLQKHKSTFPRNRSAHTSRSSHESNEVRRKSTPPSLISPDPQNPTVRIGSQVI